MVEEYTVRYRQPGQFFWRKIKRVTGDGCEHGARYFLTVDDRLLWVSGQAEIDFSPERQKVIAKRMSREIGQPVQRA